ncbi:MAG: hypothetical protein ACFCVD_09390 [Nodosilinea sp.]
MEEQKATKVTLYLPPDLHRQLKIQSAVEGEAMSAIAKRAIDFYLAHSDVVMDVIDSPFGQSHVVHSCPHCTTTLVVRQGELVEVAQSSGVGGKLTADSLVDVPEVVGEPCQFDQGELVVC